MQYLRNAWYVAAWSDQLKDDEVLARTILEQPILLFRDAQGKAQAILDRCPHRFAPLSLGRRVGDSIVCGYHGLAFDGSGACVANPHGAITRGMSVQSFPLVERHRALWIWMGPAHRADEADIPALDFLGSAAPTAFNCGYLHGRGNYQLFSDNILDLTHTDFLHANTIGNGTLSRNKGEVTEENGTIRVAYRGSDEAVPPLLARMFDSSQKRADTWTDVTWQAPAVMTLTTGAAPHGSPRERAFTLRNVHIMTPETETSTHYFFASSRNFKEDDSEINDVIANTRLMVFTTEDKPMIDAQQSRMGSADFWALKPILLQSDVGAVRARRELDRLIQEEQSPVGENA